MKNKQKSDALGSWPGWDISSKKDQGEGTEGCRWRELNQTKVESLFGEGTRDLENTTQKMCTGASSTPPADGGSWWLQLWAMGDARTWPHTCPREARHKALSLLLPKALHLQPLLHITHLLSHHLPDHPRLCHHPSKMTKDKLLTSRCSISPNTYH